jgi:hypothetical protein
MSGNANPERGYYRFYCKNSDGRIVRAADSHCETDSDALGFAPDLFEAHPCETVEVWNLARFVGSVKSATATRP